MTLDGMSRLAHDLRGRLIGPSDSDYDTARSMLDDVGRTVHVHAG